MLAGHVPFRGSNPPTVYKDIKNRNIHWPENLDEVMSKEAQDLINRMIQIEPSARLGNNLEST
jgi:serine/threonine protein kinase